MNARNTITNPFEGGLTLFPRSKLNHDASERNETLVMTELIIKTLLQNSIREITLRFVKFSVGTEKYRENCYGRRRAAN